MNCSKQMKLIDSCKRKKSCKSTATAYEYSTLQYCLVANFACMALPFNILKLVYNDNVVHNLQIEFLFYFLCCIITNNFTTTESITFKQIGSFRF